MDILYRINDVSGRDVVKIAAKLVVEHNLEVIKAQGGCVMDPNEYAQYGTGVCHIMQVLGSDFVAAVSHEIQRIQTSNVYYNKAINGETTVDF